MKYLLTLLIFFIYSSSCAQNTSINDIPSIDKVATDTFNHLEGDMNVKTTELHSPNYSLSQEYSIFKITPTDKNKKWNNEMIEIFISNLLIFYTIVLPCFICSLLIIGGIAYGIYLYSMWIEYKINQMWAESEEMIEVCSYLNSEFHLFNLDLNDPDKLLLDKATKAVEENLMKPEFDVVALVKIMNMSHSTLTRKLKMINGRTPLEFIRYIKLKHACYMLMENDKNVTEIANCLGYFNRKYFTSCFKAEFGMTPSEYKNSIHR